MRTQVLVLAKTPVPGRVKTRLCPPCSPEQAAAVAAAALADTLDAVTATRTAARTLVVDGDHAAPPGWARMTQRGGPLGERLANAYADTRTAGLASVLIGMDTPQVSPMLLEAAGRGLDRADAVLGAAEDGGWWVLGLRDARYAEVLRDVPMSTSTTGSATLAALRARGLRVGNLAVLQDVDTADAARTVAARCAAGSRFARAVAAHVPSQVPA